ncbi:MAG: universal stress protein [Sediminibacterium sp.]
MKTILIPTDLGADTSNLLTYAAHLAVSEEAVLYIMHAAPGDVSIAETTLQEVIRFALIGFENRVNYRMIVREAEFSSALINELVEELNADLLLLAAGEHTGLGNLLFGTPVTNLIATLSCPVLALPRSYAARPIHSIGYATDLVDLAERLQEIVPFARRLNAQIDVFHVYPVFPEQVSVQSYPTAQTVRLLRRQNDYEAINLYFIKTDSDNDLPGGIHQFIEGYKPDLLVMCHQPRGLFDQLIFNAGDTLSVAKKPEVPLLALSAKSACKIM